MLMTTFPFLAYTKQHNDEQAIIIEVEGDPHEIKQGISQTFPLIEVVAVYDTLLQGLALKGKTKEIEKLSRAHFVRGLYPVQTYRTSTELYSPKYLLPSLYIHKEKGNIFPSKMRESISEENFDETTVFPETLNDTEYTGKGVRVAVIDTGIDMTHPDLQKNYRCGYDLVDLDERADETSAEQGIPTSHGSHVAGIIAANGHIKGVAPDAEIYAYRALGPGGVGSSIQVIAAMEQALKDGVDIMNLSLGNTVNGPDYPTSKAVSLATEAGVAVIVANGNAGPDRWTIGAPATAKTAFSVGAYAPLSKEKFIFEAASKRKIKVIEHPMSVPWELRRDYQIASHAETQVLLNKIALIRYDAQTIEEDIQTAVEKEAVAIILYKSEKDSPDQAQELNLDEVDIPLGFVTEEDGLWLSKKNENYFTTVTEREKNMVAPFSSRGPVTINWHVKPNILAPGVNVFSTVPGGYDLYNGTSMAAPHIAGVVALVKEAQPNWSNEKIFAALETRAEPLTSKDKRLIEPYIQGAGLVRPNASINTPYIIENSLLSFGKITENIERNEAELTFHNLSDQPQKISIDLPKKIPGLSWQIPQSFIVEANEEKRVTLTLKTENPFLDEGVYDGWLKVHINNDLVSLPYILINKTDSYKKMTGFTVDINPFKKEVYSYELYATEKAKSVEVHLYDPETLLYVETLLELTDINLGLHKGEINKKDIQARGLFYGLLAAQLETGEFVNYEVPIYLP